jgi:hypothetical protein
MVRVKGVEPPRLAALDPKSSASASSAIPATYYFKNGEPCRIRTYDPLIKSQMLYQLS